MYNRVKYTLQSVNEWNFIAREGGKRCAQCVMAMAAAMAGSIPLVSAWRRMKNRNWDN